MKTFKKLTTFLVAILFVISFSSCEKQTNDMQLVSFDIENITNSFKKADPVDEDIPFCSSDMPAYVKVIIDNEEYMLNILSHLNDGTETEVLKLDVGTYTLSSFKVYALDNDSDGVDELIWATPESGSYYADLFKIKGVSFEFTIEAFEKKKIDINVLCWQDYSYKEFGFNTFDFSKVKIKSLCFFGDICVEDHVLWHDLGSYYQQATYQDSNFPAIFEVFIIDEVGDTINDTSVNANLVHPDGRIWQGVDLPLCVEYPDYIDRDDDYTFYINLILPNGDSYPIINEDFTAEQDQIDITGDDGVYDFVIGALCYGIIIPPFGDDPSPPTPIIGCETAFAKFDNVVTDDPTEEVGYVFTNKVSSNPEFYPTLNISNRWGWSGNIKENGTYTYDIWAAAGKNKTSNGYKVGVFIVDKYGDTVTVTYDMFPGYINKVIHIYAMDTPPTSTANGNYVYGDGATPGGFEPLSFIQETNFTLTFDVADSDGDGIWFIAHSEICDVNTI